MAFLDNSGDIILDAVLTDAGRKRLAKGDGSFKIVKFALGDDEINYELYNKDDSRGTPFYDLEIMQTPVLEAFTNNTATMKSKLITITRNDVLYLPVIKLNSDSSAGGSVGISSTGGLANSIPVAADSNTSTAVTAAYNADKGASKAITVDQGLNTSDISADRAIDSDLYETQYSIQIDNRLLKMTDGTAAANLVDESFIDDDNIAVYNVSDPAPGLFQDIGKGNPSVLAGPRGSRLSFGLLATTDTSTSTYLFTTLGTTGTIDGISGTFHHIDTTVRITGLTTGYRIDIPVRLLRKQ
tara:strand:+ start:982 stop:1875 length:894 start_codon:yes stop_codon:yes gene_type:complete